MGIGVSIFLIALGLILALAVEFQVAGLDIQVIGWILVIVGIVGLLMTMFIWGPRSRAARSGEVVEERRVYDDGPPVCALPHHRFAPVVVVIAALWSRFHSHSRREPLSDEGLQTPRRSRTSSLSVPPAAGTRRTALPQSCW
jgi:hypothetical protein